MATTQHRLWIFGKDPRTAAAGLALSVVFVLIIAATQAAQAQTFQVIHTFTGGADGATPNSGLTMDQAGNFYGTTGRGGTGYGTVYNLKHGGSGLVFQSLYKFAGGNDGAQPFGRVIFGPDGSLYGTTITGGGGDCYFGEGCGTVFRLRPPPHICAAFSCSWSETPLYRFQGGSDGSLPFSEVLFDQSGSLYGTTSRNFGNGVNGVVYKLTPSDGNWTESVLHTFTGPPDGDAAYQSASLIFDQFGNLFGTTDAGGTDNQGTVFELTPSGSIWIENIPYSFGEDNSGTTPESGLISDSSGNLYGTTQNTGANGGGTVFKLSPSGSAWTFTVLYSFPGSNDYPGPTGNLLMDSAGNLYGTTVRGGLHELGSVFKLTPTPTPPWTYTSLHDFTGGSDSEVPTGNLVFDSNGNLYGTASGGSGPGLVFEITQPF